jgi:hypothetical protein
VSQENVEIVRRAYEIGNRWTAKPDAEPNPEIERLLHPDVEYHSLDRRDGEAERLKALVEGANGQPLDSGHAHPASNRTAVQAENGAKSPVNSAILPE